MASVLEAPLQILPFVLYLCYLKTLLLGIIQVLCGINIHENHAVDNILLRLLYVFREKCDKNGHLLGFVP